MSDKTTIEWTEATWSPVTGCTRVSEGCRHCYIEKTPPFRMDHRKFNGPETGATTGVKLHSERLHIPLKWRKPKRIFVCSLADLFQDEVPDRFIAEVFAVMALAPQHTFQVLTKRHARMRSLLSSDEFKHKVGAAMANRAIRADDPSSRRPIVAWPLPNVWLGVSVEDQKWADIRIPALLETPAAVRWISAEPLLGPVNLRSWLTDPDFNPAYRIAKCGQQSAHARHVMEHGPDQPRNCPGTGGRAWQRRLDWVVVGGESGPGARPMLPLWATSIRRQCERAGVAFLFKQWGAWAPSANGNLTSVVDTEGHEWQARMYRAPKSATGRVLDGQTWDQYPAVTS